MQIGIEKVGPQRAGELLMMNTFNRRLRPSHVRNIARAIERGEWRLSHQGIAVGKSGVILDGQHRLHGIIKANKTVPIVVATDVDDSAFEVIDLHAKRSASDALRLPRKITETLRFLAALCEDTASLTPTHLERRYGPLLPYIEKIQEWSSSNSKTFATASVKAGAVIAMLEGGNEDYIGRVYRSIVLMHFDDMPPIAKSFVRQLTMGEASSSKSSDLFARAIIVFNEENENNKKVQVKDATIYRERGRNAILELIGEE